MTLAAGWRKAISLARFGPDTTATRSGPAPVTSPITSLIRFVVPSSMPFIRLTSTVSGGISPAQSPRFARRVCDGTARTTTSDPSSACPGSGVAHTADGSSMSGR
jgi:hypothetical protein